MLSYCCLIMKLCVWHSISISIWQHAAVDAIHWRPKDVWMWPYIVRRMETMKNCNVIRVYVGVLTRPLGKWCLERERFQRACGRFYLVVSILRAWLAPERSPPPPPFCILYFKRINFSGCESNVTWNCVGSMTDPNGRGARRQTFQTNFVRHSWRGQLNFPFSALINDTPPRRWLN